MKETRAQVREVGVRTIIVTGPGVAGTAAAVAAVAAETMRLASSAGRASGAGSRPSRRDHSRVSVITSVFSLHVPEIPCTHPLLVSVIVRVPSSFSATV